MRGHFGKQLNRILGSDKLPILLPTFKLARLIMIKSHNFAHMSASDTAARSCLEAWIVCPRMLARKIMNTYPECWRRYKVFLNQREGELPDKKMFMGYPLFTLTSINFLGPHKVKAMTNARSQMKVWPVVFGCLSTGAVHIKLNKD